MELIGLVVVYCMVICIVVLYINIPKIIQSIKKTYFSKGDIREFKLQIVNRIKIQQNPFIYFHDKPIDYHNILP